MTCRKANFLVGCDMQVENIQFNIDRRLKLGETVKDQN